LIKPKASRARSAEIYVVGMHLHRAWQSCPSSVC
jgi:23S rRNA U2552 (ribose-2'-O)-methylase RlmE/FtsJ